jgi:class 3 adenylate cyclase
MRADGSQDKLVWSKRQVVRLKTPFTSRDMRIIDDVLQMGNGYVLNFSDRTFAEFFLDEFDIDIDDDQYRIDGGSKAKRLRTFLRATEPPLVGRVLARLLEHRLGRDDDIEPSVLARYRQLADSLGAGAANVPAVQEDPGDVAVQEQLTEVHAAVATVEKSDAWRRARVLSLSRSLSDACRRANVTCRTKQFVLDEVGDEQTYGFLEVSEAGLCIAYRVRSQDLEDGLNQIPQSEWSFTPVAPNAWSLGWLRLVFEERKLDLLIDELRSTLAAIAERKPNVPSIETATGQDTKRVKANVERERPEKLYKALSRVLGLLLEATDANPFHWSKDPQHAATLREQDAKLREINSAIASRTYRLTPLQKKWVIQAAHQSLKSLRDLVSVAFQLSADHGMCWVSITKSTSLLADLFPYHPTEETNAPQPIVAGHDEFSLYFGELMGQLLKFEDAYNELRAAPNGDADPSAARDSDEDRQEMPGNNPDRVEGSEFLATVVFVALKGLKDTAEGPMVPKALRALGVALLKTHPCAYVLSTIAGAIVVIPDDVAWGLDDAFALLHQAKPGFPLRVSVTHGNVEVVTDVDGGKHLIGPMINVAARIATSADNPGALVHESYASHIASTLSSSHWLHRLKRSELMVTGKAHDDTFRCFVAPDAFEETQLECDDEFTWTNAVLISYDLSKFSGGDRSELRKRFTRLAHVFKKLLPASPVPALLSPGGDGGVLVLRGVSLREAAQIATTLRDLSEVESLGQSDAIEVKVRIGVHYGPVFEYRNARGISRPAGIEVFVADEIASDEHARQKKDVIVTRHLADSTAGGSREQLAVLFEELPALTEGPAAGIARFVRRGAAANAEEAAPPDSKPGDAPPLPSSFEPLTIAMVSTRKTTVGAAVSPAIWKLSAIPTSPVRRTRAQLHAAITDSVVHADGGTDRITRLPAVLRPGATTEQKRSDGTHVWGRVHQGLASNERQEEQLGVQSDGTIWYQRAHFWDADEVLLDMAQCAYDAIVFLKLIVGVGNALKVASYDVRLKVQAPRPDIIVTIQKHGLAAKQTMRSAKARRTSYETQLHVGPMTAMPDSVQTTLTKELVDGIANEFELESDALFRGGGPPFLEIDERSIAAVLKTFKRSGTP